MKHALRFCLAVALPLAGCASHPVAAPTQAAGSQASSPYCPPRDHALAAYGCQAGHSYGNEEIRTAGPGPVDEVLPRLSVLPRP